jgi:SAM-dependent methyltransferase
MSSGTMLRQLFSRAKNGSKDKSNGYDSVAERFMATRDPDLGAETIRKWSKALPAGASVLDLGCAHGVPVCSTLISGGFRVYGIDASEKLLSEYRKRFPDAETECASVEESKFFSRRFDGAIACGLLFLLGADAQAEVIAKIARALRSGGQFCFTAPKDAISWKDLLTGNDSRSLGAAAYRSILSSEGLTLTGESDDEGSNHYYFASKA